jgi:hypothetical protein
LIRSLRASAQRSTSVLFSFVPPLLIVAGAFAIRQSKTISRRDPDAGLTFISFRRCGVESKRARIRRVNEDLEIASLKLLCDMCNELSRAVNSLGDKPGQGLFDNFNLHSAEYVNKAVEGFIFLRQASPPRVATSKLLIRPVIEITFRLVAIQKRPELLYRVAYWESEEDWKWFAPAADRLGKKHDYDRAVHEQRRNDFKAKYVEQFPNHQVVDQTITTIELALAAGLAGFYDTHYRMYCRYTHAAFRAIGGFLDELANPEDNHTMAVCTLNTLRALAPLGADMPNLDSLSQRLDDLQHLLMEHGEGGITA